ncbi:MAG: NADH:ubiquinone reductase (Na(+)-transporting) subunit F, partial [Bacteroidetes bacterium]|nr:NADH:ubiquinone reductase (Na(+)-transporting) subunit F [Bacteroidota bacterium]
REIEKNNTNFTYKLALSEALPEDNWTGPTGFIHQAVYDNFLKDHPEPEEAEYYLCGPPQMLEAVFGMLDSIGVPRDNVAFDEF